MIITRLQYFYAICLYFSINTALAIDTDDAYKKEYLNNFQKFQLTAAMIEESNKVYNCESPEIMSREITQYIAPLIIDDQTVKKGIVHERWEIDACDLKIGMFCIVCNDPIDSGFLSFVSASRELRKDDAKDTDPKLTEHHCD